jgi:uncharacterized membrane protein HdeD (DUF308 family)
MKTRHVRDDAHPTDARQYRAVLRANFRRYGLVNCAHGILLMSAGGLAIACWWSSFSTPATVLLAVALIALAALQVLTLTLTKQLPYFSIQLVSVASLLIIGLVLVRRGQVGHFDPSYLVAAFLVIDNLSRLIFAYAIRPLDGWWLMASTSVLGLAVAAAVLQEIPDASPSSLALMTGINLVMVGLASSLVAYRSGH